MSDLECFFLPAGACSLPRRGARAARSGASRPPGSARVVKGNWTAAFRTLRYHASRGASQPTALVRRAPSHRLCGRREAPCSGLLRCPHAKTRLELRRRTERGSRRISLAVEEAAAAIHIRHGDKYTPAWIDKNHPPPTTLKDYLANASKALSIRNATGPMLVMTDDPDIIDELRSRGSDRYLIVHGRPPPGVLAGVPLPKSDRSTAAGVIGTNVLSAGWQLSQRPADGAVLGGAAQSYQRGRRPAACWWPCGGPVHCSVMFDAMGLGERVPRVRRHRGASAGAARRSPRGWRRGAALCCFCDKRGLNWAWPAVNWADSLPTEVPNRPTVPGTVESGRDGVAPGPSS